MRFIAHDYQLEAAEVLYRVPYSGLLADPGMGKTAMVLMLIHELKRRGELDAPVLLVSTPRIINNVWPDEIAKWDQFRGISHSIVHGAKKHVRVHEDTDIHLTTHGMLKWALEAGVLNKYRMLVIDESRKFGNWSSQRTKIMRTVINQFTRRHILTGTPIPESLESLFPQMFLCDGGASFGPYITHFRTEYMVDKGWGQYPNWQPRPGALDEAAEVIAPRVFRLDNSLLDLPSLHVTDVFVNIPKKAKNVVMETLRTIDLTTKIVNAGSKYMDSRRQASGILEDGAVFHTEKLEALAELISELHGKPVMVGYYFRAEGDALRERLGAKLIDGRTSPKESAKLINLWNRSKVPILGVQPNAVGHGLNLQNGGRNFIWFSYTDSQDDYDQTVKRVWRQGVGGSVHVHRIIARKTVDEAIIARLEAKKNVQAAFLGKLKELRQ